VQLERRAIGANRLRFRRARSGARNSDNVRRIMTEERAAVAAAILAGGRARRFGGADKASLSLGGRRIIDRQLAALAPIADPILVVAPDAARYADLPVRVVADAIPDAGAIGGLYTALIEAPCERVIVVACDLPFVTEALFARLIAESEGVDAVVPRSARGLEPLCALYAKRCAEPLAAAIARGERRAAALPRELRVRELGTQALAACDPDGLLFVNVNTPHDYARARARIELMSKPSKDRITEDDSADSPARP
jgi:molybdenum cofactor guanylyltransferase